MVISLSPSPNTTFMLRVHKGEIRPMLISREAAHSSGKSDRGKGKVGNRGKDDKLRSKCTITGNEGRKEVSRGGRKEWMDGRERKEERKEWKKRGRKEGRKEGGMDGRGRKEGREEWIEQDGTKEEGKMGGVNGRMDGRKGEEMKEDGRVEWGKGRRDEGENGGNWGRRNDEMKNG